MELCTEWGGGKASPIHCFPTAVRIFTQTVWALPFVSLSSVSLSIVQNVLGCPRLKDQVRCGKGNTGVNFQVLARTCSGLDFQNIVRKYPKFPHSSHPQNKTQHFVSLSIRSNLGLLKTAESQPRLSDLTCLEGSRSWCFRSMEHIRQMC